MYPISQQDLFLILEYGKTVEGIFLQRMFQLESILELKPIGLGIS